MTVERALLLTDCTQYILFAFFNVLFNPAIIAFIVLHRSLFSEIYFITKIVFGKKKEEMILK
jgi:hypothetical protein